jgi:hypothetical protein
MPSKEIKENNKKFLNEIKYSDDIDMPLFKGQK